MAGIGRSINLLRFYTLERILYNRLVCQLGKNPKAAKKVIALWLVQEELLGHHDLIRLIHAHESHAIDQLFNEAELSLACIEPGAAPPSIPTLPALNSLLRNPISPRFFYRRRELIFRCHTHIMDDVCSKIFGEVTSFEEDGMWGVQRQGTTSLAIATQILAGANNSSGRNYGSESGDSIAISFQVNTSEAGITRMGVGNNQNSSAQTFLNPEAREFSPVEIPVEARKMFLTFSNGNPLSKQEIIDFFSRNWGAVVEEVYMEQPRRSATKPQFGTVTFKTSLVIPRVLNGQPIAKFRVNGKHLWAHLYMPERTRHGRNWS